MKRLLKIGLILMVIGLVISLISCDQNEKSQENEEFAIDWRNYSGSNVAMLFRNNTEERLVVFARSVARNNLLGGIPANAIFHGISKNDKVLNKTGAYVLVFVTEEQLNEYSGNLGYLNQNPFTRIFVFFDKDNPNPSDCHIANQDGRHKLTINNSTAFDVEIRLSSYLGEPLRYVPRQENAAVLYLVGEKIPPSNSRNKYESIFPVIKFFHPTRWIVGEIFPVIQNGPDAGKLWFKSYPTSLEDPALNETLNVQDVFSSTKKTLGAAWLVIENRASIPVSFTSGSSSVRDTTGTDILLPNTDRIISISMMDNIMGMGFAPYRNIYLSVGPNNYITYPVEDDEGNNSFYLENDKQYRIRVTDSSGTLKAVFNKTGETINLDQLLSASPKL